ncbi:MAG TPA: fibro-slime domain-containing protein [Polyangiaceae bacterium]
MRSSDLWLFPALGALFLLSDSCGGGEFRSESSTGSCGADAECADGARCDVGRRVCVECLSDADCGDAETCISKTCQAVVRCSVPADCLPDRVCDEGLGRCVDCLGDGDCAATEVCVAATCRLGCDSDLDCQPLGLLCDTEAGFCADCLIHDDCAPSEYCEGGECQVDACAPGHTECSGSDLLRCSESGSGFELEACSDGCSGEPGDAACQGSTGSGSGQGGAAGSDGSTGDPGTGGTGGVGGMPGGGPCPVDANSCVTLVDGCRLELSATFRDFNRTHSDFAVSCDGLLTGLVAPELDNQGKPALVAASTLGCIQSTATYAEWYTDGAERATLPGIITLFADGASGAFVNRWGPNGEKWTTQAGAEFFRYCGPAGDGCGTCAIGAGEVCDDPCDSFGLPSYSCAVSAPEEFDGNPLFFPIDDDPGALVDTRGEARVPPDYGYLGWPSDADVLGTSVLHNFHFTTELRLRFRHRAGAGSTFQFIGDDDVWVFLNNRLIIDLGGVHVPESAAFQLNSGLDAEYGLVDGERYEIAVFHAERKEEGSSFGISLGGFELCLE